MNHAWKQVMDEEMDIHEGHGTWLLLLQDLTLLAACGYSQRSTNLMVQWTNLRHVSLPRGSLRLMKLTILRHSLMLLVSIPFVSFFSVVVNQRWHVLQLDVKNTFLYDDLRQKVYMEQPPGYVSQGKNVVWDLKKAIYGLKQSLRAYFDKFSRVINAIRFWKCYSIIIFLFILTRLAQLYWQSMFITFCSLRVI